MSKKNDKPAKKESFTQRARAAYYRGYVAGFDDCEKQNGGGNRFFGTYGFSRGIKDRRTISKINKRVARYKNKK